MNYTNEIQTLGKALLGQTKAQDKTSDARRLLAVALQNDAVNLNNVEHSASLKLDITKAYPKGTVKMQTRIKRRLCLLLGKYYQPTKKVAR
tara:strand:+ start:718 stop:990 length:273 start_codon:yes stop_codon:yes gene_type:complete